jgi:hypothetical protein
MSRNPRAYFPVKAAMNRYYFDLRSGDVAVTDDEGRVLGDIEAAHQAAVEALANAIKGVVVEGVSEQHIAVDVRDDIGLVLEISAVFASKILRKQ